MNSRVPSQLHRSDVDEQLVDGFFSTAWRAYVGTEDDDVLAARDLLGGGDGPCRDAKLTGRGMEGSTAAVPPPAKPHAKTVLVVEDDAAMAEIYQFALERAGYAVRIARDGLEGLRLATEIVPDFLFLDIRMPKLDGIGVLRGLAANSSTSAIPTVMLSNFDDPALVNESLSLGAKEYLVKAGTDPSRLASVVARWVERPGSQTAGDSDTGGEDPL